MRPVGASSAFTTRMANVPSLVSPILSGPWLAVRVNVQSMVRVDSSPLSIFLGFFAHYPSVRPNQVECGANGTGRGFVEFAEDRAALGQFFAGIELPVCGLRGPA